MPIALFRFVVAFLFQQFFGGIAGLSLSFSSSPLQFFLYHKMFYLSILFALGAALLAQAATSNQMAAFRLAYLYKGENQTSCMAAVIDMSSAFVSANCITLTGDNKVDKSVSYKIQFTPIDNQTGPTYAISSDQITIHPDYNQTTFANNVAVIQYNTGSADDYVEDVSYNPRDAETKVYVRRDYDMSTSSWDTLQLSNQDSNDASCDDGSPLYTDNGSWMTCTSAVTTSSVNSDCYIPYGVMYKQSASNTSAIALCSLYSHSVIYGSNFCTKYVKTLNYYTVLWPYLGFAVSTLGRGISIFNQTETTVTTNTTILSMTSPDKASVPKVTIEGGDLYPKQLAIGASMYSSTTDSAASGIDTSPNADGGGLSKAQKIAIGVAVPLGVILVALGGIIVHHIWKVRREDKAWDPNAQSLNLQHAAMEISADDPFVVPPPYSQVNSAPAAIPQHPEVVDVKK